MTTADAILVLLWAGLTAYALFGGADFGAGFWDLVRGGRRNDAIGSLIEDTIGPVWEANHVWLIFVIVIMFAAFPPAYAALSEALFVPFHLVLLGIILRGAAFVFRTYSPGDSRGMDGAGALRWGAVGYVSPGVNIAPVDVIAEADRGGWQ